MTTNSQAVLQHTLRDSALCAVTVQVSYHRRHYYCFADLHSYPLVMSRSGMHLVQTSVPQGHSNVIQVRCCLLMTYAATVAVAVVASDTADVVGQEWQTSGNGDLSSHTVG